MNAVNVHLFGTAASGESIYRICLHKGKISCEVITYGAALRSLVVPDRNGKPVDVVLGYDTLEQYVSETGYFGATVGRVANRIARGTFSLHDRTYNLPINNGNNHLHGGVCGFSHKVWDIEAVTQHAVVLSTVSPDGDQGYPGTLKVVTEYRLQDDALLIRHEAVSDKDTLCSLTNHSYFNLSGHDSGSAMEQELQIFANAFTPSDEESIPSGFLESVENTPMDFQKMKPMGMQIDDAYQQLEYAKGYDHNYVVEGSLGTLRKAAIVKSNVTGISMQVETTMPGVHFYTANYVPEGRVGKGGCAYGPRHAFCLETQYYPDAIHHPNFPSPILKEGEEYIQETLFRFMTSQ
ncbi:MAG: galactose mutarotase [Oscillospiraceae bacterium]|nr:galactose mutarotase [Oscillospiraceae bacterium]